MSLESIKAIKDSRPPTTDYLTYLTIVESHLSPAILPTLNEILQDAELTQNIGWDLIQLLLPLPDSGECLATIACIGNPKEVVLKVTEALTLLSLEENNGAEEENDDTDEASKVGEVLASTRISEEDSKSKTTEPTAVDKFCTLVSLLAILHPRIKTKYPSRFLSTSLMAILSAYRPSHQATHAVATFVHAISGEKRPHLPQRKSSLSATPMLTQTVSSSIAPDPEAADEDPHEAAIQNKLLQSFVTHVLEEYVNANDLEWAARLQEHFQPDKVIPTRMSVGESFKQDENLQERDICVGQLVARARGLGLSGYSFLFDTIEAVESTVSEDEDSEDDNPSSPDEIPLSKAGSLFLVTSFIFSTVIFNTNVSLSPLSIFPDHAKLVKHFIGTDGATFVGNEESGVIDAIVAIGLWLENQNQFVSGPLNDEDFLQELQTLSLLSANTPSSTLRYHAHLLTSSILHAHPVDRLRLTFICDTLEHCPYENLTASAVGWLKEEIIIAKERNSDNVFATTVAVAAAQPYLFPNVSSVADANDSDVWEELKPSFVFHMAVLNFLVFLGGDSYQHVIPSGTLTVAEEIYLGPLRGTQERLERSLKPGGHLAKSLGEFESAVARREVELLGERLSLCME